MPLDWAPFVDFVRASQRFVLTTHVRPDGDALGSMLALAAALRQQGKQVQTVVSSSVAPRYAFMDPNRQVERFALPGTRWREVDAVVVLDTGTWNQLGDFGEFLRSLPAARAVIDHHQTQDDLGAIRFVDASAEAAGRLAHQAITALGAAVTPEIASLLFVAIAMDTGWFRHSNTSADTFALQAELVRAGAKPDQLYEQLFERSTLARQKLMGLVLDRLTLTGGGRVAYSEIHRADYVTTGATPEDSEDLVNCTRGLDGVEVGLLFMEQPRGGVKVSFRSREQVNVARVAERFGGGGHRLASGATVEAALPEVRSRVLAAVGEALGVPVQER